MKKIKLFAVTAVIFGLFAVKGYCADGSLYDYPVKLWRSSITAGGMTPTLFSSTGPIVIHNLIQASTSTVGTCGEMWVLGTQNPNFDTAASTLAHRSFKNPTTVETPFNVISSSRTYIQSLCATEITILWEWLTHLSMSHIPF